MNCKPNDYVVVSRYGRNLTARVLELSGARVRIEYINPMFENVETVGLERIVKVFPSDSFNDGDWEI